MPTKVWQVHEKGKQIIPSKMGARVDATRKVKMGLSMPQGFLGVGVDHAKA